VGAALSAAGALMSDLQADHRALHYAATDRFDFEGVNRVLESLAARCAEFMQGPGTGGTAHAVELYAEARYRHQIWEIDLPLRLDRFHSDADVSRAREDFDRLHEEVFAFRDPGSDVEFVGWRATARARLGAGGFGRLEAERPLDAHVSGSRTAYFAGLGALETKVELFEAMDRGVAVEGPAVIESAFTTVVVDAGASAVRTEGGTLVITP
jgi:N-methylhydantoinase A